PRLSFFFNAHSDFFEEVAKYRAARRLWARLMRGRFGAERAESRMLRFHAQTAGCALTAQQPEVNLVRVALQGLAAVLGGCQSLHTNALDEALALPSEKAARLALRTQQVLAHEAGVTNAADPLGGSYLVEALTDRLEEAAQRYLDQIDAQGGVLRAIESGYLQREIAESAYRYQQRVESGDAVVVGVNAYLEEEPEAVEVMRVDPAIAAGQVERLNDLKRRRDGGAIERVLADLETQARGSGHLVETRVACVEQNCTLGEISDRLRTVFGVHHEVVAV